MADDSLDDLITQGGVAASSQTPAAGVPGGVNSQQPRLRKIKRPKVRPMAPAAEAPSKVYPPFNNEEQPVADVSVPAFNGQESNIMSPSAANNGEDYGQSGVSSVSESAEMNSEAGNIPEMSGSGNVLENDANEELKQSMSIVRAADAQNMVRKRDEYGNTFVTDDLEQDFDFDDDDIGDIDDVILDSDNYVKKKVLYMVAGIFLVVGLLIGNVFFATSTVENRGLEGVVVNPDVPAGRPRCGLTDKSQACVFYLMNWYKQELNGRDFYKLAAQLTGREEYMIETDNLRYATVKIKPGNFAQLNIPALQ